MVKSESQHRYLKEKNILAVRVIAGPRFGAPIFEWPVLPDVPATQQCCVGDFAKSVPGHRIGMLYAGSGFGIHREVFLETTGTVCVPEVFVRGDPRSGEAKVVPADPCLYRCRVVARDGGRMLDAVLMAKAANFNAVRACEHVLFAEARELLDRLGTTASAGRAVLQTLKRLRPWFGRGSPFSAPADSLTDDPRSGRRARVARAAASTPWPEPPDCSS